MAGALIVTGNRSANREQPGDIDVLLKDERGRPFPERVMMFQQIQYGCLNDKGADRGQADKDDEPVRPFICSPGKVGGIESFDNDWGWRRTGRYTGINGKVQPQLTAAKAGAFERWRLINGGTGESMRMRLYRLDPSRRIAADGPRRKSRLPGESATASASRLPMWQIALDGLTRSAVRKSG